MDDPKPPRTARRLYRSCRPAAAAPAEPADVLPLLAELISCYGAPDLRVPRLSRVLRGLLGGCGAGCGAATVRRPSPGRGASGDQAA